jgi:hypothetical protein
LLLPFAIFEAVSGINILLSTAHSVFQTHPEVHDTRWGMRRVQTIFEHPILYGVIVANSFGIIVGSLASALSTGKRLLVIVIVTLATFLCLSAGPITGLVAQLGLVIWARLTRNISGRWAIIVGGIIFSYVLISLLSNQSVFEFYITHFSFDQENAYYRVLIWDFGTESSALHPMFGVGFKEWERPDWMPPSIDMFWLFNAIKFGQPAAFAIGLATFYLFFKTSTLKLDDDPASSSFRFGYCLSLIGFFLAGWTVHYWNATYVYFMFILGCGGWLCERGRTAAPTSR